MCKRYFTVLTSCTDLKLSQLNVTFPFNKKCSQCTCILHFKVRPGELMIGQWAIQAWGIEMNVKLNFILISDQLHQFHIIMTREP